MLEQEAVGLQELLVRYDQLEKALIEVAVSATKALNSSTSTPTRKPPSSTNLRSRMQHRRLGSEAGQPASNAAEGEEEEAAPVPLPPLPALPVLVQKRASLADIRRKLEEEPASINEKDTTGQTPLHMACSNATNVEVVRALIAAGASVTEADSNGWTALHYACMENAHKDLIWLLLSSGADPSAANLDGTRPMHYLVCRKAIEYNRETVDHIRGAVLCLLKGGVDVNQPNRNGDTPLHLAALHDGYEVAQVLIDSGADPSITNGLGETVLHYAIMANKKVIVEKLLEKGMDPRIDSTPSVPSPLQMAANLGPAGKEMYALLRARVSVLDMKDMSPEEKKMYRRNLAIEELILTEKEYIHDLDVLVRVFLVPIQRNLADEEQKVKILDDQELRLIFGNVEEILHGSKALHQALDHAWKEALASKRAPHVGQIFLDHMSSLREYEKLCTHQQMATESLDKALGTAVDKDDGNSTGSLAFSKRFRRKEEGERSEFAQFCDEAKRHKDCRRLDIASFLIKPFQRVTKYPLLFREIISYMDASDPDYENIQKAQAEIGKMIAKANEKKRIVDNFQVLIEIQSRIILPAGSNLIKKGRAFVQEGRFHVSVNREKFAKRLLFLFSDLLILTQPVKKEVERSMYLHSIPLAAAVLSDIKEGAHEAGKMARHAFSVQHAREPLRIVAFAASDDEKRDWMHMLSTRIASAAAESQAEPTSAFASPQVFINLHTTATTNSTTPMTTTSSDSLPTVSPLSSSSSIAASASPASSAVVENMSKGRLSSSMIVRPQDRKGLGKMVQRLVEQKANRGHHHHSPKDEQPSEATTTTGGGGRSSGEASKETNRSWGEAELKLTLTEQRAGSRKSFLRANSANFARTPTTTASGPDSGDGSGSEPRPAEAELSTPRQTTFVKYKPSTSSSSSARPTSPPPASATATSSTAPAAAATTGWAPATKRSASARGGADSEAERQRKGTTAFFGLRASSDIPTTTTQPPATRPRP